MTVNIAALNIAPNRRYIIFFAYIYRWNLFYSIIVTNAAILVCSGSFWNYRQRKRRFRFQRVSQPPLDSNMQNGYMGCVSVQNI
jgi:hypothetical protein